MHYYRLSNFSPGVVRNVLGIEDYKLDKKQKIAELPKRDITTEQESIELVETIKEIETSFSNEIETGTQTNIEHREMESIMKAMTTVKEEITNELGKLTETNKHIAKENRKLKQAKEDNDEYQIKRISERIRNLESERSARLEVININKDKLRNQINRIKQTIHKILNEDTTLKEKIKTLFREQGVTIASILTAFGMIIGTIVNTFSGEGGGGGETPSKGKDGIKEWITTLIKKLGKLLANLAGKAVSALPGIIGTIVSWLLSVTGNIINWFANNLWMLLILIVGLLYTAAREYINKSHK
jgi:Fe2+ transport system protein B